MKADAKCDVILLTLSTIHATYSQVPLYISIHDIMGKVQVEPHHISYFQ